jgi:hypothetical protein
LSGQDRPAKTLTAAYQGNLSFLHGFGGKIAQEHGKKDEGGSVTIARLIRIVFGTVAGLMLILAVSDVMLTGHLSIITPASFGALLAVALAFLISNLLNGRE